MVFRSRRRSGQRGLLSHLAMLCASLLLARPSSAQIATDGSLGAARSLSGPNFSITSDLGRQVGGNLFHSFSRFDVPTGGSTTFGGPPSVRAVVARVTGGSASQIDGTIRCAIPDASVYLINPAGIAFGPHASIDVAGSFAASTASQVRLADGRIFGRPGAADALLSAAPPEAFGFLGAPPGAFTVKGTTMAVGQGKVLSLVGGAVRIEGARLSAPGGSVKVVGTAGGAGEVNNINEAGNAPHVVGAQPGDVDIAADPASRARSRLSADGAPAGDIAIVARNLRLNRAGLGSASSGGGRGLGISLVASESISLSASAVESSGTAGARAGGISVDTPVMSVTSGSLVRVRTDGDPSLPVGTRAKGIEVRTDTLTLGQASVIESTVRGGASGARVSVSGGNVLMNGRGTAIRSVVIGDGGTGGDVDVVAGHISVDGGARIETVTQEGDSNGGGLQVRGEQLLVRGGSFVGSEATAVTFDGFPDGPDDTVGAAGEVNLTLGTLRIQGAGQVGSMGFGSVSESNYGGLGNVTVVAGRVLANGDGSQILVSGVDFLGLGAGGNIDLRAGVLRLGDGASILNDSGFGRSAFALPDPGGTTRLDVVKLIDIRGSNSGMFFETHSFGGSAHIATGNLHITDGGAITATASNSMTQPLGGQVGVYASGSIVLDGGSISAAVTSAEQSSGRESSISVEAAHILILNGGSIAGGVGRDVDQGNISIRADSDVVMRGGLIRAPIPSGDPDEDAKLFGGQVLVVAPKVLLDDRSAIIVGGGGGSLFIAGDVLDLRRHSSLSATSDSANGGGGITVKERGEIRLNFSKIATESTLNSGGSITLAAPRIDMLNAELTTRAGANGGDIVASGTRLLALNQSDVVASAGINGGNITLRPQALLQSTASRIDASGERGVSGSLDITTPETTIGSRLARLASELLKVSARFSEHCTVRFTQPSSSFLSVGRGGTPIEPGGLSPTLELVTTPDSKRK